MNAPGADISSDTCRPLQQPPNMATTIYSSLWVQLHDLYSHISLQTKSQSCTDNTMQHITYHIPHQLYDFRSDKAKEYKSDTKRSIYNKPQIIHVIQEYTSDTKRAIYTKPQVLLHLRTPHQPQEKSIPECFNRTFIESMRVLLTRFHLPDEFWKETAKDTVFQSNHLRQVILNTSP